jgi:hypothetical protein
VIKCNGTGSRGWGLITGPNLGLVKEAEIESPGRNCERVEGRCERGESIKEFRAVNLPWKIHIFETEKKYLTAVEGNTEKLTPGWEIKCKSTLGTISDKCMSPEKEPEYLELTNLVQGAAGTSSLELLVRGRFEENALGNCTLGGTKAAKISGLVTALLWKGLGLSISN